jgi:lipopolysaccharide transport system ATP-binding protein
MRGSILVENLGKRFRRRTSAGSHGGAGGRKTADSGYFWGLRDIDLRIPPGRSVGVVGKNGAGKSTLLRMIGGVGTPDAGRVAVAGRIGAILDLGVGLSDDLTGRENAYVAGVIAGMTRAEVRSRYDAIVAFAELEEFIDAPLRTYSSGMRLRLAFSVAVHIDPDILLVDEALAVGDVAFQRKCLTRIAEIKGSGCTIVMVSHDMDHLRTLCDDVLHLAEGRARAFGAASEVIALYEGSDPPKPGANQAGDVQPEDQCLASEVEGALPRSSLTGARLLNPHGPVASIVSGAGLFVEVDYHARSAGEDLQATVRIERADGTICFDAAVEVSAIDPPLDVGQGTLRLTLDRLDLRPGDYGVKIGVGRQGQSPGRGDEQELPLRVIGPNAGMGIICPPVQWQVLAPAPGSQGDQGGGVRTKW